MHHYVVYKNKSFCISLGSQNHEDGYVPMFHMHETYRSAISSVVRPVALEISFNCLPTAGAGRAYSLAEQ